MPSVEHEEIVDDVLSVCNNELRKHYPGFSEPGGFGLIVEAFLAHSLMGIGYADKGPRADAYILPDDGGGPVVVEVGDMKKTSGVVMPIKMESPFVSCASVLTAL